MVEHLDMQRVLDEHTEMYEMLKHLQALRGARHLRRQSGQ